jgi:hypothetical protein
VAGVVRDVDGTIRSAHLREEHPEDIDPDVAHREPVQALAPAVVGELDRGLSDLVTASRKQVRHRIHDALDLMRYE